MKRSALAITIAAIVVAAGVAGYAIFRPQPALVIFVADAYVGEADALSSGFHNATGISVDRPLGGGSYALAREIGQGDPASVFISVALSTYNSTYLESRYSGWTVAFASDQLVLAYSPAANSSVKSIARLFNEAYGENASLYYQAFNELTSGSVKVGISNASSDPAGLRAYLSLEAAGYLYGNNTTSYFVDRLAQHDSVATASNAAELVAPLEEGDIGFLYIYKSAAISKGLDYITLPYSLNFGNSSLAGFYSKFSYQTTSGIQYGMPIYLYISAVAGGTDPAASIRFVTYAIENNSMLSSFGLVPLKVSLLFNNTAPPAQILNLVSQGKISYAGTI